MLLAFFDKESLQNYQAQLALRGIQSTVSKRKYESRIFYEVEEVPTAEGTRKPIVVFCNSEQRSLLILQALCQKNYHPIFVAGRMTVSGYRYSNVSIDYRDACYRMTKMLLRAEPSPIAFLGFNHDSIPDKLRLQGFESAVEEFGVESRVISNFGNICACIEELWQCHDQYRNVLCVNDFHAILFLQRLKREEIDPSKYQICGFGNTALSQYSSPRLTTAEINYEQAGRCAVELYTVLEKMQNLQAATLTVDTEIYARGSTRAVLSATVESPGLRDPFRENDGFYRDRCVMELDHMDSMLSVCDEIDLKILSGLLHGEPYSEICERNFIALNTIKYRVKKMISNAKVTDKNELIHRIRYYGLQIGSEKE